MPARSFVTGHIDPGRYGFFLMYPPVSTQSADSAPGTGAADFFTAVGQHWDLNWSRKGVHQNSGGRPGSKSANGKLSDIYFEKSSPSLHRAENAQFTSACSCNRQAVPILVFGCGMLPSNQGKALIGPT
jgi:hypothetical protein